MKFQITRIKVANFRSISSMDVEIKSGSPLVICGPNNIGKTNFLRALDLFFSLDTNKFRYDKDVPYHIAEGSAGGSKVNITVDFLSEVGEKYRISTKYYKRGNESILELSGKKDGNNLSDSEIKLFISNFKFIYVESNNINLPKLISNYFNDEVLPGLDRLRRRQTEPLGHLNEFISKSNEALLDIERGITQELHSLTSNIGGVNTDNWEVKVIFPEFDFLREAISNLVSYTIIDSNDRPLETKGSGIQRLLLLALIKYISEHSTEDVIWALDEPEVFLQPGLQKEVFSHLKEVASKLNVFITTHSSHFIDLNNLENTYLLDADHEVKEYARRPNRNFIKVSTKVTNYPEYEKIEKIKLHMGIGGNDGWKITPFNLLVEGQQDKDYLLALSSVFNIDPPNILVAGGADKLPGFVGFLREFSNELDFTPTINCLLDHDEKGREVHSKLNRQSNQQGNFNLSLQYVMRSDNTYESNINFEIEDLIPIQIISDAVNKILRKKGYNTIKASDISKRNNAAYKRMGILEFITNISLTNNSDKNPLDFETVSMKIYLCQEVCKLLYSKYNDHDILAEYGHVKQFLIDLYNVQVEQVQ